MGRKHGWTPEELAELERRRARAAALKKQFREALAARVRRLRKRHRFGELTQPQAAECANRSLGLIQALEAKKANPSVNALIDVVCGLTEDRGLDWLVRPLRGKGRPTRRRRR